MEENNKRVEEEVVEEAELDYVAAIKELKENTVPKSDYAKLKAENQKLIKSLINGETIQAETPKKEIDVADIERRLSDKNGQMKMLDGFKMILALREADLAAGKIDPFIPIDKRDGYTEADLDGAARRAAIYQECIDYADGDSKIFTQELNRRMVDTYNPPRRKKR